MIDQFEYPRLGPGQMWEKTRDDVIRAGGTVLMGETVVKLNREGNQIASVTTRNEAGAERVVAADEFIVTMLLRETILAR
ncbi:MAG: hypothetical protein ACFUZC_21225 [Chthoniobacteraceae bacterium]